MSMVTYYARLSEGQLSQLRASFEGLSGLHRDKPPGAELIDLDKASEVISWLLSPCKRAEQVRFAASISSVWGEETSEPAFLPSIPELDVYLIAIEGRGPNKAKELDVGLGPACLFNPEEVSGFAALLEPCSETDLRRHLDFPRMDEACLPVEYWQEEGEEVFTNYILPLFVRLKTFYRAAASAGQWVVVWNN